MPSAAPVRRRLFAALLLVIIGLPSVVAAAPAEDERMDWWRDARFGLFIHWGLYAVPAGEWNGRTGYGEWIRESAHIPVEQYDEFVPRFNPVDFDADAWVLMAKDAGMKYIVITSKHHDGFCLWDSAATDFDIMATPFKRDIMAELADACRRHDMKICWYHSIMDWHHPDYLPRRSWEDRPVGDASYERYVAYLTAQCRELLTKYGDIGVMWFDGEWEHTWTHDLGKALYDACREIQPNVIINNRVDKGRGGMEGMTSSAEFRGDFGTPEQEIPAAGLPGVDWETCMTMNTHWGYNRADMNYKSTRDLIRKLVDIASKGGNFLLNVGPTAEGRFPDESITRLREIGAWMRKNGEAISGTEAGPLSDLPWGRTTIRHGFEDSTLYLHVFEWPTNGQLIVPGLGNTFLGARLLADPSVRLTFARGSGQCEIDVPATMPDEDCTVIALELKGRPLVYRTPTITAASDVLVDELVVTLDCGARGLLVHYTLDGRPPTTASPVYREPITITDTTVLQARTFHGRRPVSTTARQTFRRVAPRAAAPEPTSAPGLRCETYPGTWDVLPRFATMTPARTEVVERIGLGADERTEFVGKRLTGFVEVPADAVYAIALISDDGSRLFIGGDLVVDNDGLHGTTEKTASVALARGWHPITVEYFNKTGGAALMVEMGAAGTPRRPLDASRFRQPTP
ncbi:MAG: alpha-L-fucosidase [Phycisphaerales bacterium]|nr:alpha-L-fucosidase [Phycisphaerales bacterium]